MIGYIKQNSIAIGLIEKIKYFFHKIEIEKFEQGVVIKLPIKEKLLKIINEGEDNLVAEKNEKLRNLKNKKKRKIYKLIEKINKNLLKEIKRLQIDTIVFSENLSKGKRSFQDIFIDNIEMVQTRKSIYCLTGRKIIEYMQFDIWKYILEIQKRKINQEDIYFLIQKDSKLDLEFLIEFVKYAKTVNIVSNNIDRFKKIQENLYKKENILISVSNNKMKALKKANYIFNINMGQKEIEKFRINKNAIIINVRRKFKYESNGFLGININDIEIKVPDEYLEKFERIHEIGTDRFNNTKLYESILLDKIQIEKNKKIVNIENNIEDMNHILAKQIIKQDEIKLVKLLGNNGEIKIEEFIKNGENNIQKNETNSNR